MIFISGVISIIIQKNALCTSKIHVIYFCPNSPDTFIFLFLGAAAAPPALQIVRLCSKQNKNNYPRSYI